MKKITFTIVGTFTNEGLSRKTVTGYEINEHAAMHKVGSTWTVSHLPLGIAIANGCRTRDEAVQQYEERRGQIERLVNDDSETARARRAEILNAPMIDETTEAKQSEAAATENKKVINLADITPENIADYLPSLLMSLNQNSNSAIILTEGIAAGKVSPMAIINYLTTGRMPHVHTFDIWARMGYTVKKGEKAAFAARIWKHIDKSHTLTAEEAESMNRENVVDGIEYHEGDEIKNGNFIKKTAYFFTLEQVEKVAPLPELPETVKKEMRGGCCWISGDTKPIKEDLKAAGFRWSKKNLAWYRREAA